MARFGVLRDGEYFNWKKFSRSIDKTQGDVKPAHSLAEAKARARSYLKRHLHWDNLGDGPLFVVGNRIDPKDQKNYEAIARVFPGVLAQHADVRLLLRLFPPKGKEAGTGWIWEMLESLKDDIQCQGKVLINPESDGPRWPWELLAADIALTPSRWEPAGQNHLQALVAGCAVIATKKGTMPEIIRHGHNGWLISDPDDDASFAQCCHDVIECRRNVNRWQKTVEEAEASTEDWDWPVLVDRSYLPMYRWAVNSVLNHGANQQA